MIRTVPLALAVALLTGPTQAAEKIALVCSGTATLENRVPHPLIGQTLTVDLEHKTVSGFLGHLAVIGGSCAPALKCRRFRPQLLEHEDHRVVCAQRVPQAPQWMSACGT